MTWLVHRICKKCGRKFSFTNDVTSFPEVCPDCLAD